MEVKINKEIRAYTESMFFGLSMRQFVFSLLAIGVAVGLYFLLKPHVGTETVSWMCVHGMTAEQLLWAWLRSEVLEPKRLYCVPTSFYYEALKDTIAVHEKEMAVGSRKKKNRSKKQVRKEEQRDA